MALSTHLLGISAPFVRINNIDIPDRIICSAMFACIMRMLIEMTPDFVTCLTNDPKGAIGEEDDG